MTVQSDKWIRNMAQNQEMINPFEENQVRGNKISYGLSSYGYDARVSNEFKIFTNVNSEIVDPKNFKQSNFISKKVVNVLFRQTHLFWPALLNISKYRTI